MEKIIKIIKRFWQFIKYYLWETPTAEPPPEEKYKLKATDVAKEYMIVLYHGQRINMLKTAYPIWLKSSRKDKRATAQKFKSMELNMEVKFMEIDGNLVCVANRDYQKRADKLKEKK